MERGRDVIILQSKNIREIVKLLFYCIPIDIPEDMIFYTLMNI